MKQHSLLFIVIVAIGLVACSALVPTSTPTAMLSGMVDVGGYELYYECSGQGSPTVILEAGMGSESSYWASVIPRVEENTRICAYDRANLGRSDEAQTPRTFQDAARDLQALLGNARIDGPYILVGHSLGGELVRVFADQYPEEVAGIVLVDAAHPDMGPRFLAGLPPESADEPENVMFWRQLFT